MQKTTFEKIVNWLNFTFDEIVFENGRYVLNNDDLNSKYEVRQEELSAICIVIDTLRKAAENRP